MSETESTPLRICNNAEQCCQKSVDVWNSGQGKPLFFYCQGTLHVQTFAYGAF